MMFYNTKRKRLLGNTLLLLIQVQYNIDLNVSLSVTNKTLLHLVILKLWRSQSLL